MNARNEIAKALGGDFDSADLLLSALAAAGFKVVGREPTFIQLEPPAKGNAAIWRSMWDAADPRGPGKEGK